MSGYGWHPELLDPFVDDPDELADDYSYGVLSLADLAVKHCLTEQEVQQFAINHGLQRNALPTLAARGVRLCAPNRDDAPQPLSPLATPLAAADSALAAQSVNERHTPQVDAMASAHLHMTHAVCNFLDAVASPTPLHPDDMRVNAMHAIKGPRDSVVGVFAQLVNSFKTLREIDLKRAGVVPEYDPHNGGNSLTLTNVQIQEGQNKTAIDESSKLAALAGMLEELRLRKERVVNP